MSLSLRRVSRAAAVVRFATTVLVAVFAATCVRDEPTAPPLRSPPSVAAHVTYTTLGTYSIPIPPDNLNGAVVPGTNTGITIAPGTYYRVRVNGTVTATVNPEFTRLWPYGGASWAGTWGPGGTGNYAELLVQLRSRRIRDGAIGTINFMNAQAGSVDSARADIVYTSDSIEIQAGRNGIACAVTNNATGEAAGCYLLSASQTVTVEKVTDVVHVVANPVAVHPNTPVTFTAFRDDSLSLIVYGWHWDADPGQPSGGYIFCGYSNPCQYTVAGSGTMTAYTNLGNPTAHVTVYSSFALAADKTNIVRGDTVTFTPLTDGVPLKAARWRWVADSMPDSPNCAAADPACKTPINAAGTMWAYTSTTSGQGDSANAHVSVRDRFELHAAPSLIAAGAVVTFRPYLNGQPRPAARWRWVPQGSGAAWDSIAGCVNGAIECHRATFVSGTMWAYRTSDPGADSAAANVTVSSGCQTLASIAPRRQPSLRGARIARPIGLSMLRRSADVTDTCTDSTATAADAGTDTLRRVTLVVDVGDGATVTPSVDSMSVPLGTVVPYSIAPNSGFRYPVATLDDSILQSGGINPGGIIVMDSTHHFRAGVMRAVDSTGLAAVYAGRIAAVIRSETPARSYKEFMEWAIGEARNHSAAEFDSLMRHADYLAFDPVRDSIDMVRVDTALAGYMFELDGDTLVAHAPSEYSQSWVQIAGRRRRQRPLPSALSTEPVGQAKPRVIYINGIHTEFATAKSTGYDYLAPIIQHDWHADSIVTVFIYNPTFSVQWYQWDRAHKCAFAAGHDLGVSKVLADHVGPLGIAVKYAVCRGWKNLNELAQLDEAEALLQVLVLKNIGGLGPPSEPAFVAFLADAAKWFHDRNIVTIFVPHSQGNLMLAQALDKPQFDEVQPSGSRVCTAATSLAPPASPSDFTQYSWMHWNGFIVYHDILTFFGIGQLNMSVDHVSSNKSLAFDSVFAYPNVPTVFDKWHWGTEIHKVIPTYLRAEVSEFRTRIDQMIRICVDNPLQP